MPTEGDIICHKTLQRASRLRSFCDVYGLARQERAGFIEMIGRRIQCGLDTVEAWGRAGKPGWSQIWREKTSAADVELR